MVTILPLQTQPLEASNKSPYESGFDHGCEDVQIDDPEDRYINEPGKGKSHHTSEFNRGYDAGFEACEGNAPPGESNAIQKALKTAEMVHLTKKFMIIAGILTKKMII